MPDVLVLGGGLAGLAAALSLGRSGFEVELHEMRAFLGGRATSYTLPASDGSDEETIDNCQHILLRCCANLLDFYQRLGVADAIQFHKEFHFIEPGGRVSHLAAGRLPAPLHFTESFARARYLSVRDKLSLARGILALKREYGRRDDLDRISMLDWLREKRQTPRAIDRFWRQVLVSAINEDLERMAAQHGFQVFRLGFLGRRESYEMGVPSVPLGALYSSEAWSKLPNVRFRTRSAVESVDVDGDAVTSVTARGERLSARWYVSALPFERLALLAPDLGVDWRAFEHSPITGIHLWFDRRVTDLPHGTLLDRTIQWFFNKGEGKYLQVVVSASRELAAKPRNEVIELAVRELSEFLPAVAEARLEKAHVVKEMRATFSARPGLDAVRPQPETRWRNFVLAGDWTASGWPATMEGAVRSGYRAAEAVCERAGKPRRFLLPDVL